MSLLSLRTVAELTSVSACRYYGMRADFLFPLSYCNMTGDSRHSGAVGVENNSDLDIFSPPQTPGIANMLQICVALAVPLIVNGTPSADKKRMFC